MHRHVRCLTSPRGRHNRAAARGWPYAARLAPHSPFFYRAHRPIHLLVPVDGAGRAADALALAARVSCAVDGVLRVVHVRIFDPPVRGAGRFFPESRADATAVLEHALLDAWECGSRVSGEVVVAERSHLAMAIVSAAQGWDAGVIVLARRPRRAISRLLLGSVADQVMRRASYPVLVTRPGLR